MPQNRAGYLRKAIIMQYRDKTHESTSKVKKCKDVFKTFDFSMEENKKSAQEDFDRDYARLTNNSRSIK